MFKVHLISMYLAITYLIVSPKWPIKISPSILVKVLEAFPWPLALVVSSKQFNLKSSNRTGPRMIIGESFPPTKTSTGPQILRQTPPPICFNRCWLTDFKISPMIWQWWPINRTPTKNPETFLPGIDHGAFWKVAMAQHQVVACQSIQLTSSSELRLRQQMYYLIGINWRHLDFKFVAVFKCYVDG